MGSEGDLVTIFSSMNAADVAVAEAELAGEGIRYTVSNEIAQSVYGFIPAMGAIEIQVCRRDAERARKVLQKLEGED
jgi:uncharacterized protein YukJ